MKMIYHCTRRNLKILLGNRVRNTLTFNIMSNIKETDQHFIVDLTNASGKRYEVGYPKSSGYTRALVEVALSKTSEDQPDTDTVLYLLEWVYKGHSDTFSQAVDTGIACGYFTDGTVIALYTYQMNFINTSGIGFIFQDASGDLYKCNAIVNGSHFIN